MPAVPLTVLRELPNVPAEHLRAQAAWKPNLLNMQQMVGTGAPHRDIREMSST